MAKHTEATELIAEAPLAVQAALTLGDGQGHKERWRIQSVLEHLEHGKNHAAQAFDKKFYNMKYSAEEAEQEIDQAICRLLMAKVQLRKRA